ncbi:MAG: preprotein translocase subunit YajC [Lachnospiraceae bacterium]|nr:preprotein translocase subunit YajC [Lachnospiraceae bacterium]
MGSLGQNGGMTMIIYVAFFIGIMYFMVIRPSNKEKKKQQELMSGLAVGDSVLTTAGFYGIIIDMTPDTVIVEFGGNKNCRIPMRKEAIVKNEKPNYNKPTEKVEAPKEEQKEKKGFASLFKK